MPVAKSPVPLVTVARSVLAVDVLRELDTASSLSLAANFSKWSLVT